MRLLLDEDAISHASSAVTVGKFDGVHLGHRALLARTRALANEMGGEAGVITFDRHPLEILRPGSEPKCLSLLPGRLNLLAAGGMDFCILLKLGSGVLDWPPEQFIDEIIVKRAAAGQVVTGEDFRYGHNRAGDIRSLVAAGLGAGFEVHIVEPVLVDGERVSSYAVRNALQDGDLDTATAMLGRHYSIDGPVIRGRQLGRTLGFPTANVEFDSSVVLPANGVYAVWANWGLGEQRGVANLGVRPTVESGPPTLLLEVHIPDWTGDIYGRSMRVAFERRIRSEMRFDSLDALKTQIARDVVGARSS